ncbi:hypothetical protein D6_0063 [Aeromonas phage D6]|uniref:Uncharacterized protein n=1 Tax=Aeromonas phage D6 TaxID=2593322 RepID=A0A514TW52_9CAUD|nr:hypothetical protein PQC08_gp212 [Aeromonas phage D6]QDJ97223.1 hypothetical protein D6_0063 [Aeromonas phage D6]
MTEYSKLDTEKLIAELKSRGYVLVASPGKGERPPAPKPIDRGCSCHCGRCRRYQTGATR